MTQNPSNQPQFFGKDDFVSFHGQVEDVDDPKRSGRVRVRCIGWHPKSKKNEKDGVTREDLPWAHVELPTTSSGQNRIGAKHRLQEGDFVRGYFLDGREAQHPVVVSSINFVANVTTENLRKKIEEDGILPDDIDGFQLVVRQEPNSGTNSEKELGGGGDDEKDSSHHVIKDDSNDGECTQERSAFGSSKEKKLDITNPFSQVYDNEVVDALCGGVAGVRDKITSILEKWIPPEYDRFIGIGDITYNVFTGNRINLNAIFLRAALEIAAEMKDTIQLKKELVQKLGNNAVFRATLLASSSRSPIIMPMVDFSLSTKFDLFNVAIDISLDKLVGQVFSAIVSINNQQSSSQGNNRTSDITIRPQTSIKNTSSLCMSDAILNKIEIYVDEEITKSQDETEKEFQARMTKINTLQQKIKDTIPEDYVCEDDMTEDIISVADEVTDSIGSKDHNNDGGGGSSSGNSMLDLVLNMDFTQLPLVFNKSGILSLTLNTQGGCSPFKMYNTLTGLAGSMAGVSAGFGSGGGSQSGKSSKRDKDLIENIGFGGVPKDVKITTDDPICEEAITRVIPQSLRRKTLEGMSFWAPVDFYEPGRVYEFRGEVLISGTQTKGSRVLVNDQPDPSENGIYVTNKKNWTRARDANDNTEFKNKKIVVAKNQPERDNIYIYTGKNNPKINFDDINFIALYSREGVSTTTENERVSLDPFVLTSPDGFNSFAIPISVPSSDEKQAINYENGLPNGVIVTNPGSGYYYDGKIPGNHFPSIFINQYAGTPTPVVDRKSGELVMILTNPVLFGDLPSPGISIIPDDSNIGMTTDDERYDVNICDMYVKNTGKLYTKDVTIKVIDRDTGEENGRVRPVLKDGRIVDVEVLNTGTGFKRIPKLIISDKSGFGSKIYAIMCLNRRPESIDALEKPVHISLCPSKNRVNYAS